MRNLRKGMAVILAAVMSASLLGGCGGNKQAETTAAAGGTTAQGTEAATTEKMEDSEPVTLRVSWWGGDSRHERLLALIDEFQKENPNIKIEPEYSAFADYRDKFTMQLTSGAAADIMAVDQPWVANIIGQGDFFVDLSQYPELDLEGFDSYVLDNFCKFDNGTFFIPAGVRSITSPAPTMPKAISTHAARKPFSIFIGLSIIIFLSIFLPPRSNFTPRKTDPRKNHKITGKIYHYIICGLLCFRTARAGTPDKNKKLSLPASKPIQTALLRFDFHFRRLLTRSGRIERDTLRSGEPENI